MKLPNLGHNKLTLKINPLMAKKTPKHRFFYLFKTTIKSSIKLGSEVAPQYGFNRI